MQAKQYKIVFRNDQDFPLSIRYESQEITSFHTHQFVELVIVLSGSGIHETKFSQDKISLGSVFVIPKGGYHRYAETDNLKLINLLFDPEKLPLPSLDLYSLSGFNALFSIKNEYFNENRFYPKFYLNKKDFAKTKWILNDMKEENVNMLPGYRCCLMGHFMILLSNLSRLYTKNISGINEPSFRIGQAISFINSHFAQNIKLEDIWQNIGMSRSTFMRKFHQAVGLSPISYLLQIRISEACRLLQQSNMNISEIAYKVGFNDSNYFTRQFYKTSGTTPREFRKNLIEGKD